MTAPAAAARRGRPPKLGRADVVEAAVALVETEGYDAVSVRRLAAELGVSTFAVQSHMGSKDELLDDVVAELLVAKHRPLKGTGDWRQALVLYATAMWDVLLEHPAVVEVLERHVTSPDIVLRDLDRIAVLAEQAGLSSSDLAEVYETVWAFVLGYAATVHARSGLDERTGRAERATEMRTSLPHAAALATALSESERMAAFPRRLSALVDALGPR